MKHFACLVLAGLAITFPAARAQAPTVGLPTSPAESLLLEYETRGCFHGTEYRLRYLSAPTPHVAVTDTTPELVRDKTGRGFVERLRAERLPDVRLSRAQVGLLQNWLAYQRWASKQCGGCTTVTTSRWTRWRNGQKVGIESHKDATCGNHTREDADPRDLKILAMPDKQRSLEPASLRGAQPILSIGRLVAAAHMAKKQGKSFATYTSPPRAKTKAFREVGYKTSEDNNTRFAESWMRRTAGYETMTREFRNTRSRRANLFGFGDVLSFDLTARRPRLLNKAHWYVPVVHDQTNYDWNQFLRLHNEVEQDAERHVWLYEWKRQTPNRSVSSNIFAMTAAKYDSDASVFETWRFAGFRGKPKHEITLSKQNGWNGRTYLGGHEERALIEEINPHMGTSTVVKNAPHWLDRQTTLFDIYAQSEADYITVTQNGEWHRRRFQETKPSKTRVAKTTSP